MMNFAYVTLLCLIVARASAHTCCRRTYPVRLAHNGPTATTIPIINKHVRTPTLERVPLRTAGCIPRPRTIDHVCTCFKTVVKPQVHNQIISVPSVQRIIQTAATPVVEKIHYEATPIESRCCCCPCSQSFASGFPTFANALCGFPKPGCGSVLTLPSCVSLPVSSLCK